MADEKSEDKIEYNYATGRHEGPRTDDAKPANDEAAAEPTHHPHAHPHKHGK